MATTRMAVARNDLLSCLRLFAGCNLDETGGSRVWRGRPYPPTPPETRRQRRLPLLTSAELQARRDVEESTAAERLATLEAADPSQQRPPYHPTSMDRVDFMEGEALGVRSLPRRNSL